MKQIFFRSMFNIRLYFFSVHCPLTSVLCFLSFVLCPLTSDLCLGADIAPKDRWYIDYDNPSLHRLEIRRGSTLILEPTVRQNGTAVNLTEANNVFLAYKAINATNYYAVTGSVYNATNGVIQIRWTSAAETTNSALIGDIYITSTTSTAVRCPLAITLTADAMYQSTASNPTARTSIDGATCTVLNPGLFPWFYLVGAPIVGQSIAWNGTNWIPSSAGAGDVIAASPNNFTGTSNTFNGATYLGDTYLYNTNTWTVFGRYALTSSLGTASTNKSTDFYLASNPSGYVDQTVTNGILAAAKSYTDGATNLNGGAISNWPSYIMTNGGTYSGLILTNLTVAGTNIGSTVAAQGVTIDTLQLSNATAFVWIGNNSNNIISATNSIGFTNAVRAAQNSATLPVGTVVATNQGSTGQSLFFDKGSPSTVNTGYWATVSGSGDMLISVYDAGGVKQVAFAGSKIGSATNADYASVANIASNLTASGSNAFYLVGVKVVAATNSDYASVANLASNVNSKVGSATNADYASVANVASNLTTAASNAFYLAGVKVVSATNSDYASVANVASNLTSAASNAFYLAGVKVVSATNADFATYATTANIASNLTAAGSNAFYLAGTKVVSSTNSDYATTANIASNLTSAGSNAFYLAGTKVVSATNADFASVISGVQSGALAGVQATQETVVAWQGSVSNRLVGMVTNGGTYSALTISNLTAAGGVNGGGNAFTNVNQIRVTNDVAIVFDETTTDCIGIESVTYPVTGQTNSVWYGYGALYQSYGSRNVAVGGRPLYQAPGSYNSAVGFTTLYQAPGSYNSAIGNSALYQAVGSNNSALGYLAGYKTGGDSNLFLGSGAGYYNGARYYTNAIAIGAGSQPSNNYTVVLGNEDIVGTYLRGIVSMPAALISGTNIGTTVAAQGVTQSTVVAWQGSVSNRLVGIVTNGGTYSALTISNLTAAGNINGGGNSGTNFNILEATNYLVLGENTNIFATVGVLRLPESTSTNRGIWFGDDAYLYRSQAGYLTTKDFSASSSLAGAVVYASSYYSGAWLGDTSFRNGGSDNKRWIWQTVLGNTNLMTLTNNAGIGQLEVGNVLVTNKLTMGGNINGGGNQATNFIFVGDGFGLTNLNISASTVDATARTAASNAQATANYASNAIALAPIRITDARFFLAGLNQAAQSVRAKFSISQKNTGRCTDLVFLYTNQLYYSVTSTVAGAADTYTNVVGDASGFIVNDMYVKPEASELTWQTCSNAAGTVVYWNCSNKVTTALGTTISRVNRLRVPDYIDATGSSNIYCNLAFLTPYTNTVGINLTYWSRTNFFTYTNNIVVSNSQSFVIPYVK